MHRIAWILALIGCGGGGGGGTPDAADIDAPVDARPVPAFRNPVALPDDQLATRALQILGAAVPGANTSSCNGCHGITKQKLRYWRTLSDAAMDTCLTDLAVGSPASAKTMLDCTREMPELDTSDYRAKKLGIYSTAARLPWFEYAFWAAYGDDAAAKHADLVAHAAMPKEGMPSWTQEEFDIVAEWYVRGLPALDTTLVTDPPPTECLPGVSNDVATHVAAMATTGWRAVNAQNQMAMYGCAGATDPRACLADKPLAVDQPYGSGWDLPDRGRARVLADVTYVTSFWTRSSPDGRFVGQGVADVPGSYILDLQRDATVSINAAYDPAFFPDNSGFVFQGGPRNTCAISVLTSNPTSISMSEAECRKISQIGLYQHVGQQLGGGDYFALDNEFESDDGGKQPTRRDPDTSFSSMAFASFTPMVYTGTTFQPRASVNLKTPFEGDSVLSPSAKLMISRVSGPDERQLGYVLRRVDATMSGTTYTIAAPEIARYCMSGGKPGFSYDERWIVFHHYEDAGTDGKANLWLMDLRTGEPVRITNMRPGQYALFPHFRSDGWIYAQVRDRTTGREYTIATDAALLLEQ